MRRRDVAFGQRYATLALADTKNRSYLGKYQFAMVRDEASTRWLAWLCCNLNDNTYLWLGSRQKFNGVWKAVISELKVSHMPLTPACLRTGGTTHLFMSGMSVESLHYS